TSDLVALKRAAVWSNRARNEFVVRVAVAAAGGTAEAGQGATRTGPEEAVVILAANAEHRARIKAALARALPLLEAGSVRVVMDAPVLPRGTRVLVDARGWGPVAEDLVRDADAASLVIDLADTEPGELARRAVRRLCEYRRRGWLIDPSGVAS